MKHPEIKVRLSGRDGNAFAVLGAVTREMRRAKLPEGEIAAFLAEAKSGDYNHLLATCVDWVNVS